LQILLRVFSVLLAVGGLFMIFASKPLIMRVFLRPPESEVSTLLLFVLKEMGGFVLTLTLMLFFASRDPVRNVAIVDAVIMGLGILALTPLLSLYTVGLGTDTEGSCRIPSAMCGIVGFKPTARRVPVTGAYPLSPTLDSVGPVANSVACCAIVDAVLAAEPRLSLIGASIGNLRFAVPRSHVLDGMCPEVSASFERALRLLAQAGARVEEISFAELNELPDINRLGGLAAPEAYARHRDRTIRESLAAFCAVENRVRLTILS
jgi:hypothetical protein